MKQSHIDNLEQEFIKDRQLPLSKGNNPVFGEGSTNAHILAIGEAPGVQENEQKRPFIGRSGQLLRKLLIESGIDLENDIYITNIVKHRPPANRDPTPIEINAYGHYLDEQINIIQPQIIITLGRFSMNKFIPQAKITQIHGQAHWITIGGNKTLIMPMFHPAAALRGTTVMNFFKADFHKLANALEYVKTMGELPPENENEETKTKNSSQEQLKFIK